MTPPKKKRKLRYFLDRLYKNKLERLKFRLKHKNNELELKADLYKNSNSLLWVWEFSKKAVLICFLFYIVVQIYSMVVMVTYCDFSYLGDLINQTGEIVQNCVFAYLVKAGVENVGKIVFSRKDDEQDEPVG